jgi:hypothetical protein
MIKSVYLRVRTGQSGTLGRLLNLWCLPGEDRETSPFPGHPSFRHSQSRLLLVSLILTFTPRVIHYDLSSFRDKLSTYPFNFSPRHHNSAKQVELVPSEVNPFLPEASAECLTRITAEWLLNLMTKPQDLPKQIKINHSVSSSGRLYCLPQLTLPRSFKLLSLNAAFLTCHSNKENSNDPPGRGRPDMPRPHLQEPRCYSRNRQPQPPREYLVERG